MNKIKKEIRTCLTCNSAFEVYPKSTQKFCSRICVKHLNTENMGGCRKGSEKSKSGYYRGIYCSSQWELAFVIYNLNRGKNITRFSGSFVYFDPIKNKTRRYFPDFLVDDEIVEIKGYKTYLDDLKMKSIGDRPKRILYGNDLKPIFEEVRSLTGLRSYELSYLYEGSPPKPVPYAGLRKPKSPEHIKKISMAMKGRKDINNFNTKPGKEHHNYGKFWINNGVINSLSNSIPDGWSKGKLVRVPGIEPGSGE